MKFKTLCGHGRALEACPLKHDDSQDEVCPFCGEGDFDLIGLKSHFENGHCEIYEKTEVRRSIL